MRVYTIKNFLKNYIDKSNSYKEILTLVTKSKKLYIDKDRTTIIYFIVLKAVINQVF